MPHQKIPDYTPVRINMLETAVENIGILEKSGVSDYTLFGSIISERSWSLPDDCNTYTSLYYDKPLDLTFLMVVEHGQNLGDQVSIFIAIQITDI
jgi:hypothetical protein